LSRYLGAVSSFWLRYSGPSATMSQYIHSFVKMDGNVRPEQASSNLWKKKKEKKNMMVMMMIIIMNIM
jgi:hypothetical protein